MEIISAMLADAATAFNGKLYVHGGGWDSLVVRQFPAAHPSIALVALLSADATEVPGSGEFSVQLVDEDGNDAGVGAAAVLGLGLGPLHKLGQKSVVPIAIPFNGVRFEKPGAYEFRFFWNGQALPRTVTFSVSTPPPTTALQQATSVPGPTD
ncbi:MAG TPA: hypothetical protein VH589_23490 [Trebonia sp.]|jgi:hypothetical protein